MDYYNEDEDEVFDEIEDQLAAFNYEDLLTNTQLFP